MIKAVIFDYGRTIVDAETGDLFPETEAIVRSLIEKKLKLVLISRSHHPQNRHKDIKRLKLKNYLSHIEVIPAEKTKDYRQVLNKLHIAGKQCIVVGDQVKNDISPGNKIGAVTVWLKKGKFANQLPSSKDEEPDYTIKSLEEFLPIVNSLI